MSAHSSKPSPAAPAAAAPAASAVDRTRIPAHVLARAALRAASRRARPPQTPHNPANEDATHNPANEDPLSSLSPFYAGTLSTARPQPRYVTSTVLYRPGWRPDYLPEHLITRLLERKHKAKPISPFDREQQYRAVHTARLALLFDRAPIRRRSIRALADACAARHTTVARYLSGREMPGFGRGLQMARFLGMDPYTLYAWLWERQAERAWWFPHERVPPSYSSRAPRPMPKYLPIDYPPGFEPIPAERVPLPAAAKTRPMEAGCHLSRPGACDWQGYDPRADPVYRAVMVRVAKE